MLSYLAEFENIFGPLRLFRYLTLRAAFAGLTAMSIGFILGPWIFAKLRQLRAKQAFRGEDEIGILAVLHASKAQTPTMGGLMICVAVVASSFTMGASQHLCLHCTHHLSRPHRNRLS
jgi:phospho-N-acetylmuramoyl-pentapeptide-transferase